MVLTLVQTGVSVIVVGLVWCAQNLADISLYFGTNKLISKLLLGCNLAYSK